MMFPDSKNVIFIKFLLRLNFSTISSGLPDFYRVKLDVIGFGQKPHFWNRETSYSNTLYLVSKGENVALLLIVKNYCGSPVVLLFLILKLNQTEDKLNRTGTEGKAECQSLKLNRTEGEIGKIHANSPNSHYVTNRVNRKPKQTLQNQFKLRVRSGLARARVCTVLSFLVVRVFGFFKYLFGFWFGLLVSYK